MKRTIGVLALQGAFSKHMEMLARVGAEPVEVREPADLSGIDGLVMPGGESTTMSKMLVSWELIEPMKGLIAGGLPVFGTCAGLILLADRLESREELPRIGGLDLTVARNAYGRQIDSFEAVLDLNVPGGVEFDGAPLNGVFIRAPRIEPDSLGAGIEVYCRFEGCPVLVRRRNILAAAFHPELTADQRLHAWFLREMVVPAGSGAQSGIRAG